MNTPLIDLESIEALPADDARVLAYEARRAARVDRLESAADRAAAASAAAYERSRQIADRIPLGQPILIGHHSERGHRADLRRIHSAMDKSVSESQRARHLQERAEAAAENDAIRTEDPNAHAKLAAKIREAEQLQERMRAANKAIRTHAKAGAEAQVAALVAQGFDALQAAKLLKPDFCGRIGFADYQLTNNNANIRRMKQRLASILTTQEAETTEAEGPTGIRIEDNPEENRIRLFFPGKPDASTRTELKRAGFRWAPSIGAWQAYRKQWNLDRARTFAGLEN